MYLSAGLIFSSFPLLIAGASEHKRDCANKGNARNPFRLSPKNGMTPRVAAHVWFPRRNLATLLKTRGTPTRVYTSRASVGICRHLNGSNDPDTVRYKVILGDRQSPRGVPTLRRTA